MRLKSITYEDHILFSQQYDKDFFNRYNDKYGFDIDYDAEALNVQTTKLAQGSEAICVFVNDKVTAEVVEQLAELNVKIIALRCAGFNNVDLDAAARYNIRVCRVLAYSPEAVAEHAVAMILTLNRKTHKYPGAGEGGRCTHKYQRWRIN